MKRNQPQSRPAVMLACVEGLPPQAIIPALMLGCSVLVVDTQPDGSPAPARRSSPAELLREMSSPSAAVCPPRVYLDGKGGLIFAR